MLSSCRMTRGLGASLLKDSDRIFKNIYGDLKADLSGALERNDWGSTEDILKKGRPWIHSEVKASELRGRGGAGFPTAAKWGFMKPPGDKPHYLVINADEGEPGACKDRQLLKNEPHKLLEGCLIAGYTLHAHTCYIYIRGEFIHEAEQVQKAIDEATSAGLIGENNKFGWPFHVYVHRGAGAYVCGEETGLLNSLEGKAGRPRYRPPFPAIAGLYQMPTIVNNVETIASLPEILKRGSSWYTSLGLPGSRGTKVFSVSGHVNHPCVVEESMGISLKELIETHAGGVRGGWDNLLAVIPGGTSTPLLTRDAAAKAVMGYDELKAQGTMLGTGSVIVMDKSTDIIAAYTRVASFYADESCGQCGVCKMGTAMMTKLMRKFENGTATSKDLTELQEMAEGTKGGVCGLTAAAAEPMKAFIKSFKDLLLERTQSK